MSGLNETPNNPAGYTPGPASGTANDPFTGSAGTAPGSADPYTAPAYGAPGSVPPGYMPPAVSGLPNPGLATLLGFIPGVGAMYNGQFAKGIAHVVIFAILISLSDHVNGIFGLLVAGWIFYMVFDAYQTARARRDGLVPPDPFGLNNIGEKMGIGSGPNWSDFTARPAPGTMPPPYTPPPAAGYTEYHDSNMHVTTGPGGTTYSSPDFGYTSGPGGSRYADATSSYASGPYAGQVPPYAPQAAADATAYGTVYTSPMPSMVPPPLPPTNADSLPTGAIWLIGFGVFALIGTLSHRFYWSSRFLDGAIVSAIGIALLITRTLRARGVYPAGSAANTWYLLRTARAGIAVLAIGVALTLDHLGSITWSYIWPYLLILLGVYLLLERAAHNRMLAEGPLTPASYGTDPTVTPEPTTASFVPRAEEGRQP